MGKAARIKRERSAAPPPPVGKAARHSEQMRLVKLGTAGVAVVIAVVVAVLLATRSSTPTPAAASPSAADANAPASLVAAAQKVGFHPTTEAGVGQVESKPASAGGPPSNPNLLPVGSQAPAFALKTPQGATVKLSDFRGKAVLLEFFASWCPHCNAEAPYLRKLYASLPHDRYAFVSVNADGETAPSVYAFHRYYGLQYAALVDPSSQPGSFKSPGAAGRVTSAYQVQSFPTFYVLDGHGKIVWRSDGEQPNALLRNELAAAARA